MLTPRGFAPGRKMTPCQAPAPGAKPLFPATPLIDTLKQDHPLVAMAKKIDWSGLAESFRKLRDSGQGRPILPLRLMTGLLSLKCIRGLSDDEVVARWQENMRRQAFTGQESFVVKAPCSSSRLTQLRKRITDEGCQSLFAESVRVHGPKALESSCIADTTVQEKNIAFPTDRKLMPRAIAMILMTGSFLSVAESGVPKILDELGLGPKCLRLATALIAPRMLFPASENAASKWLVDNTGTPKLAGLSPLAFCPMALHRIGGMPGGLKAETEDRLSRINSPLGQIKSVLMYDLANAFLEGSYEDVPMAQRGFSKEKRCDCKLVSLAVCVDHQGGVARAVPHPGSVSEPSTLREVLGKRNLGPGTIV
jgi:hypothetical protein